MLLDCIVVCCEYVERLVCCMLCLICDMSMQGELCVESM